MPNYTEQEQSHRMAMKHKSIAKHIICKLIMRITVNDEFTIITNKFLKNNVFGS